MDFAGYADPESGTDGGRAVDHRPDMPVRRCMSARMAKNKGPERKSGPMSTRMIEHELVEVQFTSLRIVHL